MGSEAVNEIGDLKLRIKALEKQVLAILRFLDEATREGLSNPVDSAGDPS